MNEQNTANAYLKTKVMTASPEELRLLLIDGAIKFARQAMSGLENKNPELTFSGFSQCRDIILELLNTIKPEHAPQIAQSVKDLYTYMYGELVKASINKDSRVLNEVIELLEYERETWVLTMQQVAHDREHGITVGAPSGASGMYAQPAGHKPISFQA